jgi:serine phosphatase RsbU (regulator of sigma subunit)
LLYKHFSLDDHGSSPRTSNGSARRVSSAQPPPSSLASSNELKVRERPIRLTVNQSLASDNPESVQSPDEGRIASSYPSIPGVDIAVGAMLGTRSKGDGPSGDFLDVFKLAGGFGFSVGSIAGRGQTTAALAKVARFTLQAEAFRDAGSAHDGADPSVDHTMRSAGALLSQSLRRQNSLSLLYGYYEPERCGLTFCNCSQWPPALMRNGVVTFLEERHPQMGQQWHRQYPPVQLQLMPGDVFVAYTHGLPEARRGRGVLGVGGVRRVLQEHNDDSAADVLQSLLALPRGFCGEAEPAEDALVFVARAGTAGK